MKDCGKHSITSDSERRLRAWGELCRGWTINKFNFSWRLLQNFLSLSFFVDGQYFMHEFLMKLLFNSGIQTNAAELRETTLVNQRNFRSRFNCSPLSFSSAGGISHGTVTTTLTNFPLDKWFSLLPENSRQQLCHNGNSRTRDLHSLDFRDRRTSINASECWRRRRVSLP